jgi:peroxiredoxin/DNA-binding transcriptional MerR regulator
VLFMRIGDLARKTGTTRKALRYYEQLGLLAPARSGNGYREYPDEAVRAVEVIRSLQEAGIPAQQCRPFLDCLDAGHQHPGDCVSSMAVYRSAITEITRRTDGLEAIRHALMERLETAAERAISPASPARRQPRMDSAMHDYTEPPASLPEPQDDGAADHLPGLRLPALRLPGTHGGTVALNALPAGRTVLYIYPLTRRPGVDLPDGWTAIPGASGCTPESCGFRDHHAELLDAGASAVFGLSSQDTGYQAEVAERLALPFAVLSDPGLQLAGALGLPTFTAGGQRLYKRLTLIVTGGMIEHAFYPIFPPGQHAQQVLSWLTQTPADT